MALNLITTKLMQPPPPPRVVVRPRLYQHLDSGLATKLILVSASAGSGKSTLLASWLEQHGWSDEAIHQALLAGDFERAGRLVEEVTFNLGVYWNSAQVSKLMARLPLELIATFPRLSLYYVWPLLNTGQMAALATFLPILERSVSSSRQPRAMRALGLALEGYQRMWLMDFAGAVALGHKALAVLEEAGAEPASDEERFMRAGVTNLIAYCHLHSDVAEADRFYPTARERSRRFGNLGSMSFTLARHGRVKHRLGQLRSAWELFQTGFEVERSRQREGERREVNVAELCVSAARLLYEWNRLDEAQSYLERADPRRQHPYIQSLLRAFPQGGMDRTKSGATQAASVAVPAWLEPLSAREHTVLRHLAAGHSNKDIAKALDLSPNTVRWYVSNLLGKLRVGSRLEAVSRARELGLL